MSVPMSAGERLFIEEFRAGVRADQLRGRPARKRKPKVATRTRDVRLRYLARRLHALGERPLFEFLKELEAGADLRARLERYARLDPELIRSLGGDQFAVGVIDGGRSCR
jgi:hypothetical protein